MLALLTPRCTIERAIESSMNASPVITANPFSLTLSFPPRNIYQTPDRSLSHNRRRGNSIHTLALLGVFSARGWVFAVCVSLLCVMTWEKGIKPITGPPLLKPVTHSGRSEAHTLYYCQFFMRLPTRRFS